jgi:cytochrome c oxidase cbb3-type subunit I/II
MYWTGITQALMWKQFTPEGILVYPNFLETVLQLVPMYWTRAFGGTLYLTGSLVMLYNLIKTARAGDPIPDEEMEAPALQPIESVPGEFKHRWIEARPVPFIILALVAVAIGGIVEFVPMFVVKSNIPTISTVTPYSPLELEGRDLYIKEGCVNCHSQMIRPFRSETERYGEYSKAGEYVYDHPFLWGSKRTGPDLHREGVGKLRKPDAWHYNHMENPRSMSPGSIMPVYPWLLERSNDYAHLPKKISVMRTLGVPYPEGYEDQALADLKTQADGIVANLKNAGIETTWDKEIIAMIAYLQKLGTGILPK